MNWRQSGQVSYELWRSTILAAGGPADLASRSAYDAAGDLSALALAMLGEESLYGVLFNRNTPDSLNPLNLRPRGGDGYQRFASYAEGIAEWRARLLDPGYAYAGTTDVLSLVSVFAPASDSNDPAAYAAHVLARLARWGIQESPMPDLVFGLVPYPAVIASHLPLSNPYVKQGAPSIPEAVFWHRMIGTLWGTDSHFRGGNAATAYGIGVISIDGQDDAGRIIEWLDPATTLYGESSGPAVGPYGDGLKLIEQVGVGNVNRLSKAIEISGNYDTPLDEPAREAIVNLTAYFADQRKIPWDQFPIVPGTDRSFVCWHSEITGDAYKLCPGAVVRNETSALIARVAQRLKEYQTDSTVQKPPTYAAPQLPEWFARSLEQSRPSDAKDGDVLWRVVRRNVEALKRTQRYSEPSTKAKRSGPPVEVREKVYVERSAEIPYTDSKGRAKKRKWYLTEDGHYVVASGFTPDIIIRAR